MCVRACEHAQMAPENTLMSFEKALEAGGEGLETDVTIRYEMCLIHQNNSNLDQMTASHQLYTVSSLTKEGLHSSLRI